MSDASAEQQPQVVDDNSKVETYDEQPNTDAANEGEESESVEANKISGSELTDISQDNIIEGERSTRAKDFSGDDKLDAKVDEVAQADPGMA